VKRREFIALLGGIATWPFPVCAQRTRKQPVIGFLGQSTRSATSEWVAALVERLRSSREGRAIAPNIRWPMVAPIVCQIAADFSAQHVIVVRDPTGSCGKTASVIPIVFALLRSDRYRPGRQPARQWQCHWFGNSANVSWQTARLPTSSFGLARGNHRQRR
jgi:hypothetical protein